MKSNKPNDNFESTALTDRSEDLNSPKVDFKSDPSVRRWALASMAALGILIAGGEVKADNSDPSAACKNNPGCNESYLNQYRPGFDLSPEEQNLMQKMQEVFYRFYINPSFLLYIQRLSLQPEVDQALEAAIRYPDELNYRREGPGMFEITKRFNGNNNISDDLKIRVKNDQITEVGVDKTKRSITINPKAYMDLPEAEEKMKRMGKIVNEMLVIAASEGNYKLLLNMIREEQLFFGAYNFQMPQRLRRLIALRSGKVALSQNDRNNPAKQRFYKDLLALEDSNTDRAIAPDEDAGSKAMRDLAEYLEGHATNIDAFAKENEDGTTDVIKTDYRLTVIVEGPGLYSITPQSAAINPPVFGFSREGYITSTIDKGIPKKYNGAIQKRYQKRLAKRKP